MCIRDRMHAGDQNVLCYELDFLFTLFFLQVTSMPFRRDLIFNLFCMQVTILSFWIELDLDPLLPAGDHHDVLD